MGETISLVKKIPLNDVHEMLGAKMVPFAGFMMPVRYSSDIEEHLTVRKEVGVFDVSHMGEFLITGKKALGLIQTVTSNDASKLTDGRIQYSCLPNEHGGIVDDILVYRIKEDEYMLVVNASNIDKDWNWINAHNTMGAELKNISENLCLFAVQGPNAAKVIQKLTSLHVEQIPYYSFKVGEFAEVSDVIISATGYTGAGGFEIYIRNEAALKIWNSILEAGKEYDIKPIGLGARDTLRLEMGYCLYGNDITDATSPIEANLGWITKFTKKFINSEYLEKQKISGVSKKLVGFELLDRGIPRSHYEISSGEGSRIGEVTSGSQSPSLGKGIGMGYVECAYATPGTLIYINVRGKLLKAQIVTLPFIKN